MLPPEIYFRSHLLDKFLIRRVCPLCRFRFGTHKMPNLSRLPTKLTTTGSLSPPSPHSPLCPAVCHVLQTAARLVAMSKLSSTRLDSGNSLRSNYFKLPGNVAWLTSCLPLPQHLPASRHMCAMWGCLSHCLYTCGCCVCVLQQLLEHGSNTDRSAVETLSTSSADWNRQSCLTARLPACVAHAIHHMPHAVAACHTRRML